MAERVNHDVAGLGLQQLVVWREHPATVGTAPIKQAVGACGLRAF